MTYHRPAGDIWADWVDKGAEIKRTFERRIFMTFERILEIGVDNWADHILLIICDLIQLVPLPSAKFSHFKLIVLLPAHQREGGSRILSRIMFNLMQIKSLKVEVKCSSCSFSFSCRAFRIRLDGLWLMSSDVLRFTEFLTTCRSFFLSSGSWLCSFFCWSTFFAEVSVLSRALHIFNVHRQETASDFKIDWIYLYRYPSQIKLRWPLFVSTSVTSILFEILKLNEKSIHIYLPLVGVHVAVKSLSFCSVIFTQIQIFLFQNS